MKNKILTILAFFGIIFCGSISYNNAHAAISGSFYPGNGTYVSLNNLASGYTVEDGNGGSLVWEYDSSSNITTITLNSYTSTADISYDRNDTYTYTTVLVLNGESTINNSFRVGSNLEAIGDGTLNAKSISARNTTLKSGSYNIQDSLSTGYSARLGYDVLLENVADFNGGIVGYNVKINSSNISNISTINSYYTAYINNSTVGTINSITSGLNTTLSAFDSIGDIDGSFTAKDSTFGTIGDINGSFMVKTSIIGSMGNITDCWTLSVDSTDIGEHGFIDPPNRLTLINAGTFSFVGDDDCIYLDDVEIRNTTLKFDSLSVTVEGSLTLQDATIELSNGRSTFEYIGYNPASIIGSTFYVHDLAGAIEKETAAISLRATADSIRGSTFRVHDVDSYSGLAIENAFGYPVILDAGTIIDIKNAESGILSKEGGLDVRGANISIENCDQGILTEGVFSVSGGEINISSDDSIPTAMGIFSYGTLVITGGDININMPGYGLFALYQIVLTGGDIQISSDMAAILAYDPSDNSTDPTIFIIDTLEPVFGDADNYEIRTDSINHIATFANSDGPFMGADAIPFSDDYKSKSAKNISFRQKGWTSISVDGDVDIEAIIPGKISLEISSEDIYITLDTPALKTGSVELEGYTNAASGYNISLNTKDGYSELKPANEAITTKIPSISTNTTAADFPTSGWGVSLDDGANFSPIPNTNQTVYTTTENGVHTHTFTAGARANLHEIVTGEYTNSLVFTATINI